MSNNKNPFNDPRKSAEIDDVVKAIKGQEQVLRDGNLSPL